jgi:hypothetical protein
VIHFIFISDMYVWPDAKEKMTERDKVALLLEMITDSGNSSVRLHATRSLAHLARGDGTSLSALLIRAQ